MDSNSKILKGHSLLCFHKIASNLYYLLHYTIIYDETQYLHINSSKDIKIRVAIYALATSITAEYKEHSAVEKYYDWICLFKKIGKLEY